jgi:hypothetical protein
VSSKLHEASVSCFALQYAIKRMQLTVASSSPVSTAHSLAVLSMEPVAISVDCGLKDNATISVWCLHDFSEEEIESAGRADSRTYGMPLPAQRVDASARICVPQFASFVKRSSDYFITVRIIEGNCIHHIFVTLQSQKFLR